MKKTLFSALAAGVLLAGGAAQAQDLPSQILGAILNNANNGYVYQPAPQYQYGPPVRMLQDELGRQFYYDGQGNRVYLNNGLPHPHANYGAAYGGAQAYGAPYAYRNDARNRDRDRDGIANRYDLDRDGDGVQNRYDRYPNDRRYR